MELIIHCGAHEIGGNCVELSTKNSRILIDFGIPLVFDQKGPFDSRILEGKSVKELKELKILPDIKGLYKDEEKEIGAILISHSHLDHYGFLKYVNQDIPIYLSQGADSLIKISDVFAFAKTGNLNVRMIKHKEVFSVGDFRITPYLVDHSAFDALAFLIEAERKRLFYSGDFRGHGRKSVLFESMIKAPPKNIDCLLTEGSTLGRSEKLYKDEEAVQAKIEEILKPHNNITFLFVSSQNIDRIVSAYKACLKTNSIFVIDIYTAFILDNLREVSQNIPQFDWENIRVKFLKYQADMLVKAGHENLLFVYNKNKIKIPEINCNKNKTLMLARDNSAFPPILRGINKVEGARIIYSLWKEYLTDKFRQFCKEKELIIEFVHTSGHATIDDLKTFAEALNPKILVPIHTLFAYKYKELYGNINLLDNGEPFTI